MSCVYCSNPASYFESKSCSNKHKIHKDCIKKNLVFNKISDCKKCIRLVIDVKENTENLCFICGLSVPIDYKCKLYRNLCGECRPIYMKSSHFKDCRVCKEKNAEFMDSCRKCNKFYAKSGLFFTPKCKKHKFCKNCINKNETNQISCGSCAGYFNHLGKIYQKDTVYCILCGISPDRSFSCEMNHSCCRSCLEFLNLNLIGTYSIISKCELCVQRLRNHYTKIENIPKEPDPAPPKNGIGLPKNPEISETKNESKSSIRMYILYSSVPKGETEKKNEDPVVPVLPRKNEEKKPKKKKMKKTSAIEYNSHYKYERYCSTCKNNKSIAFSCGHYNCFHCLGTKYAEGIVYTIALIEKRHYDLVPRHYEFTCITQDCRYRVYLPSRMIYNKIGNQLTEPQKLIYFNLMPYFDGLPVTVTECRCNNRIFCYQNARVNCTCLS